MLKAWNFNKRKIYDRWFDNNLQKYFRTKILKNSNGQILLIVVLMVSWWFKLQMEIIGLNDPIFARLPSLHISICILRIVMYPSAEARPVYSQQIKINLFARRVKIFKLMLLTIFVKSTMMGVWRALITPLPCSNACNYLALWWRKSFSYRNQSIDLQSS